MKASKSSTSDRRLDLSHETSAPADMDSCVTITDETVLADQSAATNSITATREQPVHTVSKPSVACKGTSSVTPAAARIVAANAEVVETAAKSTSHLFDLVNADSPVAQVS